MKNMRNPPADAAGRVLRVFQVFHVLHVFHASPMFAYVVERTPGFGSFLPPCDEGNSRLVVCVGSKGVIRFKKGVKQHVSVQFGA